MKYLKTFETTEALDAFKTENEYPENTIFYNKEMKEYSYGYNTFPYTFKVVKADGSYVVGADADITSLTDKEDYIRIYTKNSMSRTILTGFTNLEEVILANIPIEVSQDIDVSSPTKIKKLDFSKLQTYDFRVTAKDQPLLEKIIYPDNFDGPNQQRSIHNNPKLKTIVWGKNCRLSSFRNYSPFYDNPSIQEVIFKGNAISWSKHLQSANVGRSNIPESIEVNMPSSFFEYCDIYSIKYPKNLVGINSNGLLFSGIRTFPNVSTLKYCDLNIGSFETITIPTSIEFISTHPFNVQGNTTISIDYSNKYYTTGSVDHNNQESCHVLVDKESGQMLKYCINSDIVSPAHITIYSLLDYCIHNNPDLHVVTLPSTIKQISSNNFIQCRNLKSVILLSELPPLLKAGCFVEVPNLESIYVPSNSVSAYKAATNWASLEDKIKPMVDTVLYENDTIHTITGPIITKSDIDPYRSTLTKVELGTVARISDNAFKNCSNLSEVVLTDNLIHIGTSAFEGCTSLSEITLTNVRHIDKDAFKGCTNLVSVTLPQRYPPLLSNKATANDIFVDTNDNFNIYIPAEGIIYYEKATGWIRYKDRFKFIPTPTSLTLTDNTTVNLGNITELTRSILEPYTNIKSIDIGSSVTSIGNQAFEGIITFAKNSTHVSSGRFFTSILTIPNSVTDIGDNIVSNTNIEVINISLNILSLGTFIECTNLKAVCFEGIVNKSIMELCPNSQGSLNYVFDPSVILYFRSKDYNSTDANNIANQAREQGYTVRMYQY